MDPRDHRLGQGADRLHHRRAAREEIGEIGAPPVLRLASLRHLLQVVTGAEGLACPRQDHGANVLLLAQAAQFGLKRGQHGVGQSVQPVGGIEAQMRDGAFVAAFQN